MGNDVLMAVVLSVVLSLLISIIEIKSRSQVREFASCFGTSFSVFLSILIIGNTASTLAAVAIVPASEQSTAGEPSSRKPAATTRPADQLQAGLPLSSRLFTRGTLWFWYAFVGVFAFEAILQRLNVTFVDKGVLTINDWITKARDDACAAAIAAQVSRDQQRVQQLAQRLSQKFQATELNTHILNFFGSGHVQALEAAAAADNADPIKVKAWALATGDYERASKLI